MYYVDSLTTCIEPVLPGREIDCQKKNIYYAHSFQLYRELTVVENNKRSISQPNVEEVSAIGWRKSILLLPWKKRTFSLSIEDGGGGEDKKEGRKEGRKEEKKEEEEET